jgi:uroporphyrinogen-III decarboxylase
MGQILSFYEFCKEEARNFEFHGRPVSIAPPVALGTDGPLTIANGIRGPQIFEDMLADEDTFHRLMDFITEATIARIRAWRAALGRDPRPDCGGLADDAIQFVSARAYRDKILPYHRRIFQALYGPGPHGMHLCGNVQRHFPTLIKELNVKSFDTGFPIDFKTLRDEIGEEVEIQGGVPVGRLLNDDPETIRRETREILASGIRRGGRFILKEANDLAPGMPLANLEAMYATNRAFGKYE